MPFFGNLETYSSHTALVNEAGEAISYAQFISDADAIAEKIERRCVVFMICRNCAESLTGYVAFLRSGVVPVLLGDSIDRLLLNDLNKSYHPLYFYLPIECSEGITGIQVFSYGTYTLLKLPFEQDFAIYADLALLLPTSGSTGSPKFVRQSYKNLQVNTESIIDYLHITENDRPITTLPPNYTYGMSILNTHLYTGATVILSNASLMEQRFWSLLKKEKVTTFGGVPYTFEMLKRLHFEKMELPDLRYITQAGGKLSKELAKEFITLCKKKGIQFIIMYGQTEASPRMSYLPWEFAEEKADSIGIAIPGGYFMLEDSDGAAIELPDVTGELVYHGENVTLGYAETRFDLIKGDDNHGVLHTGDMAKRDIDGFYYIVGRKKRFLKLFGNRINLDEVENLLKKEGIECACAGVDDKLRIFVTDEKDIERTNSFVTKHTEINRNGFKVLFINKIPRNESGKILYSELNG
jgi:acyl-CoA synthetase (AMP-forming)/AMP-acid ligase II